MCGLRGNGARHLTEAHTAAATAKGWIERRSVPKLKKAEPLARRDLLKRVSALVFDALWLRLTG